MLAHPLQLVNPVHVQHQVALRVHMERGQEFRAPQNLIVPVRILRVHHLAERIVEALDQNQQLRLRPFKSSAVFPLNGLAASIGCTTVQVSGKKYTFRRLQRQIDEGALELPVGSDPPS